MTISNVLNGSIFDEKFKCQSHECQNHSKAPDNEDEEEGVCGEFLFGAVNSVED